MERMTHPLVLLLKTDSAESIWQRKKESRSFQPDNIRKHIDEKFKFKRTLDFGCGVGRLVIPFANVAQEVTAIDVSDSMLNEAKKNCQARAVNNVVFAKLNDKLTSLHGKYDFIHCFNVFQHIPEKRGQQLLSRLLGTLKAMASVSYNSYTPR